MHHRAHAEPSRWQGTHVRLSPSSTHHLTDVMRAQPGAMITVFDGKGREADCRFESVSGGEAELSIVTSHSTGMPASCITLFQAVPKGKRMDLVVEKAVEIGAAVIQPVLAERGIVRLQDEQREARAQRWRRVALSAAKQCGAAWLTDVRPPCPLHNVVDDLRACELLLLAHLGAGTKPLRDVLERARHAAPASVGLLVGPEGDWTDAEVRSALDAGAIPVAYGPRVLRVETAALYGLSAIAYELAT